MGQASVVSRLRTGDIRSVPLAVWLFGALTLLYLGVLITDQGSTGNLLLLPMLLITQLGPLVFATVLAYLVPTDRRILRAAALIAVPSILLMLTLLARRTPDLPLEIRQFSPFSVSWLFEVAGLVLLAIALGGVRSRVGRIALLIGVIVFTIGDIQLAFNWAANPLPDESEFPIYRVALSFAFGLTTIGWAFVLGAALDHRLRAFAIAAGIFLALDVFALISQWLLVDVLEPLPPDLLTWFTLPFQIGGVIAWLAMIGAAITEVPRRGATTDEPETAT